PSHGRPRGAGIARAHRHSRGWPLYPGIARYAPPLDWVEQPANPFPDEPLSRGRSVLAHAEHTGNPIRGRRVESKRISGAQGGWVMAEAWRQGGIARRVGSAVRTVRHRRQGPHSGPYQNSISVLGHDRRDLANHAALIDAVIVGDLLTDGGNGPMFHHLERHAQLGGLGAHAGSAQDQYGSMYGDGGLRFRHALLGQPTILLFENGLKTAIELRVVQLPGPAAFELAVKPGCQRRQHAVHQLHILERPRPLR